MQEKRVGAVPVAGSMAGEKIGDMNGGSSHKRSSSKSKSKTSKQKVKKKKKNISADNAEEGTSEGIKKKARKSTTTKKTAKKKQGSLKDKTAQSSRKRSDSDGLDDLQQTKLNYRQSTMSGNSVSTTFNTQSIKDRQGNDELDNLQQQKLRYRQSGMPTVSAGTSSNRTNQSQSATTTPRGRQEFSDNGNNLRPSATINNNDGRPGGNTAPGALRVNVRREEDSGELTFHAEDRPQQNRSLNIAINHIRPNISMLGPSAPQPASTDRVNQSMDGGSAPMIQAELVNDVQVVEAELLDESEKPEPHDEFVFKDEESGIKQRNRTQVREEPRLIGFFSTPLGLALFCCCMLIILIVSIMIPVLFMTGGDGSSNSTNGVPAGTPSISPSNNESPSSSPSNKDDTNVGDNAEDIFASTNQPANLPTNPPTQPPSQAPTWPIGSCAVRVKDLDSAGGETVFSGLDFANRYNGVRWTNATTEIVSIDDEQTEVPVLEHLLCDHAEEGKISSACGSQTENWNQDVTIENCPKVTCKGHEAACFGSKIIGSNVVDCNSYNDCESAKITQVRGPNPEAICYRRNSCKNSVIEVAPEISGMKVTCRFSNACNNAYIDAGQEGTVTCQGSDRGVGCQSGTTVLAKCLVCYPEWRDNKDRYQNPGCGTGVTFNGQDVPATTPGYCGDCDGVLEADGLVNICNT